MTGRRFKTLAGLSFHQIMACPEKAVACVQRARSAELNGPPRRLRVQAGGVSPLGSGLEMATKRNRWPDTDLNRAGEPDALRGLSRDAAALAFGLGVFGVNWVLFMTFVPMVFPGALPDTALRVGLDILLVKGAALLVGALQRQAAG
ncbi:MAG: hypothetical protein ACXIVG_05575 [Pararhodobacter sp.]